MDRADLRIFEAVARLGGMSRAAAELNTVQSNVTARIRLLEEELGAPLFERHSRGVTLTAAGRRLLPYAASARQLFEEARRAVRGRRHAARAADDRLARDHRSAAPLAAARRLSSRPAPRSTSCCAPAPPAS